MQMTEMIDDRYYMKFLLWSDVPPSAVDSRSKPPWLALAAELVVVAAAS